MAVATVTVEQGGQLGSDSNAYWATGTIKINTYASGGQPVGAGVISGQGVKIERVGYLAATSGGYVSDFDVANQKVKFRLNKDPGAAGGADVVLPEVADTTDLSAVTVPFFAVGQ